MSTPTAICLDTEVFERLNFNFAATMLQEFVKLCKEREVNLLVPGPIKDEIRRHMFDRAVELDAALDKVEHDARRKCSFLESWDRYPKVPKELDRRARLRTLCVDAWDGFARQVTTDHLTYQGVSLAAIMSKYHFMHPPFAPGEKRKEFPDAISLAILDVYARKHNTTVGVVSGDGGMKAGCDGYQNLLYFPSLASLLESFLAEDERVDLYVNLINASIDELNGVLSQEVSENGSFHHNDRSYKKVRDVLLGVDVSSFDVIGLGINECTIAFSAGFESEHELSWEDFEPDGRPYEHEGWIKEEFGFGGTAKIRFSADDQELVSCDQVEIDTHNFSLSKTPRSW